MKTNNILHIKKFLLPTFLSTLVSCSSTTFVKYNVSLKDVKKNDQNVEVIKNSSIITKYIDITATFMPDSSIDVKIVNKKDKLIKIFWNESYLLNTDINMPKALSALYIPNSVNPNVQDNESVIFPHSTADFIVYKKDEVKLVLDNNHFVTKKSNPHPLVAFSKGPDNQFIDVFNSTGPALIQHDHLHQHQMMHNPAMLLNNNSYIPNTMVIQSAVPYREHLYHNGIFPRKFKNIKDQEIEKTLAPLIGRDFQLNLKYSVNNEKNKVYNITFNVINFSICKKHYDLVKNTQSADSDC